MSVPQNCVRINGEIYPTDNIGRVEVKCKKTGQRFRLSPIDVKEHFAQGENCTIEIYTPSRGPENTMNEVQRPVPPSTNGGLGADITKKTGVEQLEGSMSG